jgi:ABC-type multidrug transport system fused ATPase/permease subunit
MKALVLFTISMLLFIGIIVYCGILPYTSSSFGHKENSFSHMISKLNLNLRENLLHIKPAKDYSNDPREKERLEVLKTVTVGGAPMTAEERKIVNYKEYDEADRLPDFAYLLTFVLIGAIFSLPFGGAASFKFIFILSIILCFFSWTLVLTAFAIGFIFVPAVACLMIVNAFKS